MFAVGNIELPPGSVVGDYTVTIYFQDVDSGSQTQGKAQFTLAPPALGVVNARLTADPEGNFDRAAKFQVGETLHVHYFAVGFKRQGDTI